MEIFGSCFIRLKMAERANMSLMTLRSLERGFHLVVVGGSAVEFYTEGGYMSGDIDFFRKTFKSIPPRLMQEVAESLGGKGLGRNWLIWPTCATSRCSGSCKNLERR